MQEQNKTNDNNNLIKKKISQADIPSMTLQQALRVAQAITDNYAKMPTKPLDIALALNMSPQSGPFRQLLGASIGYGLTDGGPNASIVSLTSLGKRIVAPLEDGDDVKAQREAIMVPKVQKEFLKKYDGSPLPAEKIALNVIESMGVPQDRGQGVYKIIVKNAEQVGCTKNIKDKMYIDLGGQTTRTEKVQEYIEQDAPDAIPDNPISPLREQLQGPRLSRPTQNVAVFISHGKNREVVNQIKEVVTYGKFIPIVAEETNTTSIPVPEKVMSDMKKCFAGVIHVEGEKSMTDENGKEVKILNQNVLIEIGAALALYGKNTILLVERGTQLPSNLQGLYRCEYEGKTLDGSATMKLLKTFNDLESDIE